MASVYIHSHSILSSLGNSSQENFDAVLSGTTGLHFYPEHTMGIPEAFVASCIDTQILLQHYASISDKPCSRFEQMAICSVYEALLNTSIDTSSERTLFILSTTKGNVDVLEQSSTHDTEYLWHSAQIIASFFNNPNEAIVVSNACISGVSALIVAKRLLLSGSYDHAIVVGADMVSKFIVSGFQSFKALSQQACKPFDAARTGLNIGEAAATIVLGVCEHKETLPQNTILLEHEAITNDANHISGPSRTGEGLYLGLQQVMQHVQASDIGFINAHGTATPYNDEMESIAIARAGLQHVPVQSLKGYFGHTLGAAGLVEVCISAMALQNNMLVKSLGFDTIGVSHELDIITQQRTKSMKRCIKMVSGFGGCNAVCMLYKV